ncbi:MAG: bifunctional (p)ppGpp synthetase/guanosine-3',5'-bis(diphosphate) 3'-pyrophosphohydrolase [Desulforegulaceae bacterium]|nr:bifunctional (p)ppGpp synthetase/guanosine-3',5'-bis(diphosphate) 3'-pyrophosphohydrolase [Desulforegulaceae bacterium]
MIRINDILDKILEYHPDADLDIVERAYIYSARVHEGQTRLSGEPYLSHPLAVAWILATMRFDVVSIAAALLHDVIEDTHATYEEVASIFGNEVAHIVSGVTKISKLKFESAEDRQAESLRKMILAMADDLRVILIKLADRLHNMETLQFHKNESKKKRIAQETRDIYSPLASRLGIYSIKQKFDEIAFEVLYPEEFKEIEALTTSNIEEKEQYIDKVRKIIIDELEKNLIEAEVLGRYKTIPSIYEKMLKQNLKFDEVYDLIAFRVVVETIPKCYEVLGLIHNLWRPIAHKIKDYIGMPKANMYQSLHTTVIGPYGERMEIQIRTHAMDRVAKTGVAAHWSYKEGKTVDPKIVKSFEWVQNLVENQADFPEPEEFLENVKIDLFPDEVYVFTPRGDIKNLPKGSTPIDFAYSVHTDVGNTCAGAKVNSRMVPLHHKLKNGDTVEVITSNNVNPNHDWLSFVKSVRARSRIKRYIKQKDKERSLGLGREMCEKIFKKHKLNFNKLYSTDEMTEIAFRYGYKESEDLIAAVGYGKITPRQILNRFLENREEKEEKEGQENIYDESAEALFQSGEGEIIVDGLDDLLTRRGKCCNPVPGDPIIGYITEGHGITIHVKNCPNVKTSANPDRLVPASWGKTTEGTYPVRLIVFVEDRVGAAAEITGSVSESNANIAELSLKRQENGNGVRFDMTINVPNREILEKILKKIKSVKDVYEVKRIKS